MSNNLNLVIAPRRKMTNGLEFLKLIVTNGINL